MAARLAAVAAVAGLVALLAYGLATKAPQARIDDGLARSQAVVPPRFELPVLQRGELGRSLSRRLGPALADDRLALTELRGLPIVLNFWASWCPPCRTEAPLLERSWRQSRPQGLVFLGLNQQDLTGDARAFMREFHTSYLTVRDESDDVARKWGVTGLPETFFLDRRGRVVGHVIGAIASSQLRRGIAAARAGRPLATRAGGDRRPIR